MKLQTKVSLLVLPLVVGAILLAGVWSWRQAEAEIQRAVSAHLETVLDSYVQEQLRASHRLLERNGLQEVDSFVRDYQRRAASAAAAVMRDRSGHLFALDRKGAPVFCSRSEDAELMASRWQGMAQGVLDATPGGIKGRLPTQDGGQIYVARGFAPWGWAVFLAVPEKQAFAGLTRMRWGVLGLAGLCAVVSVLAIFLVLRRVFVGPVDRLKEGAEAIARRERLERIPVNSRDELGSLARGMEDMASSIDRYEAQAAAWHQELEAEVQRRTDELRQANRALLSEVEERQQAEEALRASRKEYQALVENSPDVVARYDRRGRHLFINSAATAYTGMKPEDMTHKSFRELGVDAEFARQWEDILAEVHQTGRPAKHELNLSTRAGERAFETRLLPELDEGGEVRSVLAISRDITEQRAGEEKYQMLFQSMLEGFALHEIILGPDGSPADYRFLDVNPAFERLTGLSAEEVVGRRVLEVLPDTEPLWIERFGRVALGGPPETFHSYAGELDRYFEVVAFSPAPRQFAAIFRDRTDAQLAEKRHAELESQLRQAQKLESVGRLAGGVAHDFNNLLGVIMGYAELTLEDLDPGNPVHGPLQQIHDAGHKARELTRQLLAFGRKQVLQIESVSLGEVVRGFDNILRRLIGEDIVVSTLLRPGPDRIDADTAMIEQVLLNLAINARDAMPQGGTLTIETGTAELDEEYAATHPGVEPGLHAMLAVSDTGVGMEEDIREKVFEPFFTTKPKGEGSGLGLSTVYGIVKQHEGSIWVYSEPGQGSVFKLYFPMSQHRQPRAPEARPEKEPQTGAETVLLVEDEDAVRDLLVRTLEAVGYRVLPAALPDQALELAAGHPGPVHLLLTDVVMPQMDGRELFNRMAEDRQEMRVLFMSGYSENVIGHHGVLDPGVSFLQKPFAVSALRAKVREVLG